MNVSSSRIFGAPVGPNGRPAGSTVHKPTVTDGVRALQSGDQTRGRDLLRQAAGLPPRTFGLSEGVRALQAGDQARGQDLLRQAAGLPSEKGVSAAVRAMQGGDQQRAYQLLREAAGLSSPNSTFSAEA
ncbi:MAG: hypothetical protein U0931_38785 [Vulcanimicrobiota bacterium]